MNEAAPVNHADLAVAIEAYHRETPLCGTIKISGPEGVTRFHIASLTKMFIAAAVHRLADDGVLDLGNHPGRYLQPFAAIDPQVTLHHLLSHTSGLADIYGVPDLRIVAARLAPDGASVPDYLAALPQEFAPGDRWRYSSTGFLILAYVAATVSGQPFGALLKQLFFDPIGMADTGEDNPLVINPGRAYGHVRRDGRDWNAENDRLAALDAPRELYSTVRDLDLWGRAILAGRVLSPAAAERCFTSYAAVDFDPSLGYGHGWFLGNTFRMIGGGTPGFSSAMWQFPARQVNIAMLWNHEQVDPHKLFRSIRPLLGV